MDTNRELLLYLVAKVARLDAIASTIHSMLHKDLMPADKAQAKQREWAIQQIYNDSIAGEKEHLKMQFPDDFEVLNQHLSLAQAESNEQTLRTLLGILDGTLGIPPAFQPPSDSEGHPPEAQP
jgi:hypothetical protein